jgi:hypothetical protein
MSLEVKKFSDYNKDAYYKDILDIKEDLGIIKVIFVRESSKTGVTKIQPSGYKAHQFLGIAPQDHEIDPEFHKNWADKTINFSFSPDRSPRTYTQ